MIELAKLLGGRAPGRAAALSGAAFTVTRREWIAGSLLAGVAAVLALSGMESAAKAAGAGADRDGGNDIQVNLDINGRMHRVRIDPGTTLLDLVRERLGLTGTKKGCDMGQCGACTVLVDGRRINACLTLAATIEGSKVVTIEGLARSDVLHPVQAAFLAEDGYQCGYCTPGQIMSAVGLLAEGRGASEREIREFMSGNICRCGAYPNIVRAVMRAKRGA